MIFSDYGHMATSIKLCYNALRQHFPDKKLIAIFQPHQINRVLRERKEFSEVLKNFDHTYIYNIYAARENLNEQLENFKHLNIQNANSIVEL
jgi:UDP-N-acetylmuramate--alanine ligase